MSKDPKGKGMSWKQPQGASAPSPAVRKREWQPGGAKPASNRGRRLLLVAALGGAILIALIVIVGELLDPLKQPQVVLTGAPTYTALASPHNATGKATIDLFVEWMRTTPNAPQLVTEPADVVQRDSWNQTVRLSGDAAIVAYFAQPGGVDFKGPFLWIVDPEAKSPELKHRLYVSEVLNWLAQFPNRQKLLVFDTAHAPISWAHGMVHDDFARALKSLEPQIGDIPNLVVFCSADEGQRSWFSEEWRQTSFGHFLLEGWKGAAGEKNSRITAASLFEYVHRQTRDWARANRAAVQEPILLPAKQKELAKDFQLASVNHSKYLQSVVSIEQSPGFSFSVHAGLKAAWERRDELSRGVPPPQAVMPHVWRRYQDALLRAEQLHRCGVAIEPALAQVRALESTLSLATWQNLQSIGHAVPMPRALGLPAATVDAGSIARLWNADDGGLKAWTEMRQASTAPTQLRLAVASELLQTLQRPDRAPDAANMAKVARILGNVDLSLAPPAESHLLLLLHRDLLPTRPDPALVRKALTLRQEAERTALIGDAPADEFPYSEQVSPWIATAVSDADLVRLRGEDLLFSTEAADWQKADKLLTEAAARYREIAAQAAMLRRAIRLRDRVAAELPYYARWIAGMQSEFSGERIESLVQQVERLAREYHVLVQSLERGPEGKQAPAADRLDALQKDIQDLQRLFEEFLAALNDSALPTNWRQIENALQAPFIPAGQRVQLLESLRRISSALARQDLQKEGAAPLPPPSVVETAQRHGRLSMALLGERWIDDKSVRAHGGDQVRYYVAELKHLLERRDAAVPELQKAGEQLGALWRALASEIDAVHQEAHRENPPSALKLLTRAESLAQLLDSATALPPGRDPLVYLRQHRLHHFLAAQARRTLDAGWASASPAETRSYAEIAANALLQDARRLMLEEHADASSSDRDRLLASVNALIPRLKVTPFDILADQSAVPLTEQDVRISCSFKVVPPPAQRYGYPVVRYHASGPMVLPSSWSEGRRPLIRFVEGMPPPDSELLPVTVDVDRSRVSKEEGNVRVELLHRGHRRIAKVDADLSGKPDVVWTYHPPQGLAGVAVKADERFRSGAVAIVLDVSGSMNEGNKFDEAVLALGELLRNLPDGTEISIGIFPETESDRPVRFLRKRARPDYSRNPAELRKLLDEIGRIKPEGTSPIAYALRQAKEEGLSPSFIGFKTVLVLTDGHDTTRDITPGQVVRKAFTDSDIIPQLVIFRAKPDEEAKAIEQFGLVREFEPPGQLWPARNQAELIDRLRDAMLPRVRFLQANRLAPQLPEGLRISLPPVGATHIDIDNQHWTPPLNEGAYTIQTLSTTKTRLVLERGDRLLLELRRDDNEVRFAPARYADEVTRLHPRLRTTAQNVRLAVANCRLVSPRDVDDLKILALLERDPGKQDELALIKPRFVWFELQTQNPPAINRGLMPLVVENAPYFPASAWKLRSPAWPAATATETNPRKNPAVPSLAAWWLDRWPGGANSVVRPANVSIDRAFQGKKVTVDGVEVTIQSVTVEDGHLKVKLVTAPDKPPVMVRLDELAKSDPADLHQEHRFYIKSGQYTASFGRLDPLDEKSAFALVFHSIQNLKSVGVPLKIDLRDPPDFNRDLIEPRPKPLEKLR